MHRIEGEPKGRQTRVLGEGGLSQSLGLVPAAQDTQAHKGIGSARIHTHTDTETHAQMSTHKLPSGKVTR